MTQIQAVPRSPTSLKSSEATPENHSRRTGFRLNESGMTLIEIMVVLLIVGGMAAILGQTVFKNLKNSEVKQTKIQFKEIMKQLELYKNDCGSFPTTEQGLQALITDPGKDVCPNWGPESYLKTEPKDAWKKPLIYESDGNEFVLKSLGSDRKDGGTGAAKDLLSTDPD